MSIITKQGDQGSTALMFNRQVSKCHPRVEACGAVDELNASLGLARATVAIEEVRHHLVSIQKDLIVLMGELATATADLPRYFKAGFPRVTSEMTARLEGLARALEADDSPRQGWALPGANAGSATLDVARATCRRAERRVCGLQETGQLDNPEIIVFLNRLSDLLWLYARAMESPSSG